MKKNLFVSLIMIGAVIISEKLYKNRNMLKIVEPTLFKKYEILKEEDKEYAVILTLPSMENFLTVEANIENNELNLCWKNPKMITMSNREITYKEFKNVKKILK
ncbi:hypothetical protein [Cetobacterium somerae]